MSRPKPLYPGMTRFSFHQGLVEAHHLCNKPKISRIVGISPRPGHVFNRAVTSYRHTTPPRSRIYVWIIEDRAKSLLEPFDIPGIRQDKQIQIGRCPGQSVQPQRDRPEDGILNFLITKSLKYRSQPILIEG